MEKAKKPFYKRWWFFAILVFLLLGAIASQGEETQELERDKPKAEVNDDKKPEKVEVEPEKERESVVLEVTDTAIDMAVETTLQTPEVSDAAISVKNDTISFAVIVGASTNKETAQEIGDNFIRQLSAFTDGSTPTKDYYGELYDEFDVLITIADPAENIIAQGAKVRTSPKITW
ncbi:hypothetical protein PZE06_18800 [Robertmurraya sp. DFI.2.37]|uniref:hypothetical protein n=1 Tax=Robertmurraya sp. DFI.2.37 TaxID=3031819 RepID=UPI0023DC4F77|nr:hypothetical protein [Robertmurraya sp. DFI.2.37]MDF1510187.1 hypothetical protein [Robertmurraya sp. DFI.2.37]